MEKREGKNHKFLLREANFIMENFSYHNWTKTYFGPNQIEAHLAEEIKNYGSNVLLTYGGGSIKKTVLFDRLKKVLDSASIKITEAGGIGPNPQYTSVNRAAKICRENNCDVVLAVGGGSVIDASKVITRARFYDGDCWDLVTEKASVDKALPLITIVTIASAGSENDAWAVISNAQTNQMLDPWNKAYQPLVSFVDPTISYSVGAYQTAAGAADTLSHITDIRYFINEHKIDFVNEMMKAMARAVIKYATMFYR